MSTEFLTITEQNINYAFEKQDAPRMAREAAILMNDYAMNMSEVYPNEIQFIKIVSPRMRTEPDFLFRESYVSELKKMLNHSQRIIHNELDVTSAKLFFDSWFYEVTKSGNLVCIYNEHEMVNISEAANYLNVTRPTLYKYLERGLETVGGKNNQRIPRFILDAWKNPELAFKMQWNYQLKRARTQTLEERLDEINKRISEFEIEYGKPFYVLFGHLNRKSIEEHSESIDISDWLELENEKQTLLDRLKG